MKRSKVRDYAALKVTLEQGHFGPFRHDMNKLGGGLLDDAHIKYQGFRPSGFRQEDFLKFLFYQNRKNWYCPLATMHFNLSI